MMHYRSDLLENFKSHSTVEYNDKDYIYWLESQILSSPAMEAMRYLNVNSNPTFHRSNYDHFDIEDVVSEAKFISSELSLSNKDLVLSIPSLAFTFIKNVQSRTDNSPYYPFISVQELEDCIATSGHVSVLYAYYNRQNGSIPYFPNGELMISRCPWLSLRYAIVTRRRFYAGEHLISRNPELSLLYIRHLELDEFLEAEDVLSSDVDYALRYARLIDRPFPRGEYIISTSARASLDYASRILYDRFILGEEAISRDKEITMKYIKLVVRGEFPLGEEIISTCAQSSYDYARNVLFGRFPLGEPAILNSPEYRMSYLIFLDSLK